MGHLLAPLAGTLLIASSFPPQYGYQWGSHLRLAPWWSSDRLRVIHDGADHLRVSKLRAIAGHDLAQQHLRVGWENLAATGNCSRCDKCLCTMTTIVACGRSQAFRSFDWPASLADRIERLPWTRVIRTYEELLGEALEARLARTIRALLRRSSGRAPLVDSRRQWRDSVRLGGTNSP